MPTSNHHPYSYPRMVAEMVLSWLIPGSGFILHKDIYRGIAIFTALSLTFLFGILLHGTVIFPILSPGEQGFNVIHILTFLAHMGFGSMSLLCLASKNTGMVFLQGNQAYALFDLASFYLIIAGGLNYLMLFNFYDRHLRPRKKSTPGKDHESR